MVEPSPMFSKDLIITNFNTTDFVNHILLIFKLYIYKSREKKFININNFIAGIQKVKMTEKEITLNNSKKNNCLYKKWHLTDNIIPIT